MEEEEARREARMHMQPRGKLLFEDGNDEPTDAELRHEDEGDGNVEGELGPGSAPNAWRGASLSGTIDSKTIC